MDQEPKCKRALPHDGPVKPDVAWTSDMLLRWSVERLREADVDTPQLDSELLLAQLLKVDRHSVWAHPERNLPQQDHSKYCEWVARRQRREPLAYILGHREFWSLDFEVNSHVLTPRPETELLIEHILKLSKSTGRRALRFLDIGTGSGCIAIVLAREFPESRVTAIDVSRDALAMAQRNARRLGVERQIDWVHGDLFERVDRGTRYDFILSNPPYIPEEHWAQLMPEVKEYEPRLALDGGPGGLSIFERMIPQAERYMNPGGSMVLEIWPDQAPALERLIQRCGKFEAVVVHKDYQGHNRFLSFRRSSDG